MKLKNKILLALFGILFISSASASLCTDIYYPVCGQDGITYKNSCYLKEAGAKINHFGDCESKEIPKEDLTQKSTVSKVEARINIFLNNIFAKYKMDLDGKISYINKLVSQIESLKGPTKEQKQEVNNALINYKNKLVLIQNKEKEEKAKLEKQKQELIQKEKDLAKQLEEQNNKETTVIIAKEEHEEEEEDDDDDNNNHKQKNNEEENKYITENSPEKINLLRINYIKDNIGTRALGGARITAFNIVGKTEDNKSGITDNYTIVVSQEFYKDSSGRIHTGVETILPALIQSKTYDNKYEIIGHKIPRGGNLYESDINQIFPKDFAEKLQKKADFFFEKTQELKEINMKNAKIYFENN